MSVVSPLISSPIWKKGIGNSVPPWLVSPSEEVIKSNVFGLYLRKYGIWGGWLSIPVSNLILYFSVIFTILRLQSTKIQMAFGSCKVTTLPFGKVSVVVSVSLLYEKTPGRLNDSTSLVMVTVALGVKFLQSPEFLCQYGPHKAKKLWNFNKRSCGLGYGHWKYFWPFFIGPWYLRSPVVCKNHVCV